MATARPRPLVVLLLLTAATALPVTANTQALQCLGVQDVTKGSPAVFPLDERSTRSIRFSLSDVVFTLGEGSAGNFTPFIDLEMKKPSASSKAKLATLRVTVEGEKKPLLNNRVDSSWLEDDGQAMLFLGEATLSIAFSKGNSKFLQQFSDPVLAGLSAVQVTGDLEVEECEGPERVPDTTTTTTAEPTTTATTTTTSEPTTTASLVDTTAAVTTTPESTTVTPVADTSAFTPEPTTAASVASTSTFTPANAESTVSTPDDADNATTSDDEPFPPCVPASDAVTDSVAVTACSTPSSDSVEVEASVQCVDVPRWAWACAGLSVVFFLFIVVLIIYSITLYRRSWKHGKASGSYGMSAQDMHYYEMRNNNLMIGNTVPRIVTPRPYSTPGLSPSPSVNRLSRSLSPSRSSTPFPLPLQSPDLENSVITSTDRREKSRSSKVSFAEE